jgi:hypothetical protein
MVDRVGVGSDYSAMIRYTPGYRAFSMIFARRFVGKGNRHLAFPSKLEDKLRFHLLTFGERSEARETGASQMPV